MRGPFGLKKWHVALMAVTLAAALPGYFLFQRWDRSDPWLGKLSAYRDTQDYNALVKAVQDAPPPPEGFSFVVLGDTRTDFEAAEGVLTRAKAENPAFVLETGDLVRSGTASEFISYHLPLVRLLDPVPLIPVPGNHDLSRFEDGYAFKSLYGDDHFSFDYGECRFVGFNNAGEDAVRLRDLEFLRSELSKPGARFKFVVMHVPPPYIESFCHSAGRRGFRSGVAEFRNLMAAMKVNEVFMGHIHGVATGVVDGVRYTVTGGAGAELTDNLGPEGGVHNFVLVRVGPAGVRTDVLRMAAGRWDRAGLGDSLPILATAPSGPTRPSGAWPQRR